ncbi:hypothetical protein NPIL_252071, partial [Nephila pilipes]
LSKNGQINQKSCRSLNEGREDCVKKNIYTVRCALNGTATKECIAEVASFLRGNICNG